jgi:hypothetical protein
MCNYMCMGCGVGRVGHSYRLRWVRAGVVCLCVELCHLCCVEIASPECAQAVLCRIVVWLGNSIDS